MHRVRRFLPAVQILLSLATLALVSCADILGFEEGLLPPGEDGGLSTGGSSSDSGVSGRGGSGIDVATGDGRLDDAGRGATGGADASTGGSAGTGGAGGSGGSGAGGATGGSGGTAGGSGGTTGGTGGATGGSAGATGGSAGAMGGSGGTTGGSGGTDGGPTCGANQKMCGSACVSTTDPAFGCGASTCSPCTFPNAAATCAPSGQCSMGACNSGFGNCNTADPKDGCETDLSKPETCGSCTKMCDAAAPLCSSSNGTFQCVTGCTAPASTRCGSQCVDVQNNVDHCGTCDAKCPRPSAHGSAACRSGRCVTECETSYTPCGTECVDTKSDLAHCGACNQSCNKTCVLGLCCAAGQSNCSGVCSDTKTDLANCGACGSTCSGTCTNGTCCAPGQTYCSGACVDTQTNTANCGGCGNTCAGTCTTGVCCTASTACSPTSPCFNLNSDANNCGACGHSCLGGSCAGGACQPLVISATSPSSILYSFAIDDQNVYWNERTDTTSALKTCPKSGCTGPARTLTTFPGVGVNMVYDRASNILFIARGSDLLVDGYDTSGTRVFQVSTPSGMAWAVTTDANYVYFSEGNSIVRSAKDGTNRTVIASGLATAVQALGVDTTANMIYAALNGDASLIRTPSTGSAQDAWSHFGPGIQRAAFDLTVANGYVYWTNTGTPPNRSDGGVYMCSTTNCSQATALFAGDSGGAIAADGSNVYFGAAGSIYRCGATACGAGPVKVPTGFAIVNFSGATLRMDARAIYWGETWGPVSKLAR